MATDLALSGVTTLVLLLDYHKVALPHGLVVIVATLLSAATAVSGAMLSATAFVTLLQSAKNSEPPSWLMRATLIILLSWDDVCDLGSSWFVALVSHVCLVDSASTAFGASACVRTATWAVQIADGLAAGCASWFLWSASSLSSSQHTSSASRGAALLPLTLGTACAVGFAMVEAWTDQIMIPVSHSSGG